MQRLLLLFCLLLTLTRCQRDVDPITPIEEKVEKPKKIVLSFYNGTRLHKKWVYEIISGDMNSKAVIHWTDSMYNDMPGRSHFFKARQTFEYNPAAGMYASITSENSGSGFTNHWNNDQVELMESHYNNYKLTNSFVSTGPSGISLHNSLLQLFRDSLQKKEDFRIQNSVTWHLYGNKRYFDVVYGFPSEAWNFFTMDADRIILRESVEPPPSVNFPSAMRYYQYYGDELPWYVPQKVDSSIFYTRSPYVCDSFVLRNGEYLYLPATGTFASALERKIVYNYSKDTTAIKSFIDFINPIIKEPLWFYISAEAYSNYGFDVREGSNYTDLYNWMAAKSVDSVFTMNGDRRVLKQVTVTTNTVERDGNGRIVKITNKAHNRSDYKIMELTY